MSASHSTPTPVVPRKKISSFNPAELHRCDHPLIVTQAFADVNDERWCEQLVDLFGGQLVDYQVRRSKDTHIELFESSFLEFLEGLQDDSCHDTSWYLQDECLLDTPAAAHLQQGLQLPREQFGDDLFSLFPAPVRPQKSCLIVGGVGARSFLHADPYEWVGWNYLLEGRKLWTFIPPEDAIDEALQAYRLPPNAWDGQYNISAGWQTSVDLYRRRSKRRRGGNAPGDPARGRGSQFGFDVEGAAGALVGSRAIEVVQEEGDLVLIPPRWWHQVYHLEPSIAVASQYMTEANKHQVFDHILEWCRADRSQLPPQFEAMSVQQQINAVLRTGLVSRHGTPHGELLYQQLLFSKSDREPPAASH